MLHELLFVRPDYVVQRGDSEDRCPEAHRVVRNAVAIAYVVHSLPGAELIDAMTAIERAETPIDGVRVLTPHDASSLATVLDRVDELLKTSLDQEWRPQGPGGREISDEAALSSTLSDGSHDRDRVFEITPEGRVALQYPRISLPELYERLPEVASFLRRAGKEGHNVIVDE